MARERSASNENGGSTATAIEARPRTRRGAGAKASRMAADSSNRGNPASNGKAPPRRRSTDRPARRGTGAGTNHKPGTLIIIGGHENKDGDAEILKVVAESVNGGRLVVMTCATEDPEGAWKEYREVFRELGVRDLAHVDIRDRSAAVARDIGAPIDEANGVFFTGGDQLRITSHIGDTPAFEAIVGLLERGGIVAGTSAGASAMSETMLVTGESSNTPTIGDVVKMAPGLGLLHGVVVDMHFSERGRLGRLLGVIAQNPRVLGIGIDEDTAVVVRGDVLRVIGSGGVYIVDGRNSGGANIAEGGDGETLTIEDVRLHLLSAGKGYNLAAREPLSAEELEAVEPSDAIMTEAAAATAA